MISFHDDQSTTKNTSWWKRRTKLEFWLIGVAIMLAIVAIAVVILHVQFVGAKQTNGSTQKTEVCYTPACMTTSSNILKYIDNSIDPCDDFYQFACGRFIKDTIIPAGKTSIDAQSAVKKTVEEQLKALVQEPSNPNDPKPFKLFKQFYSMCMNTTTIENDGYDPLFTSIINVLGGWPVLDRQWKENGFEWKTFLYKARKMGLDVYNSFLMIFLKPLPTDPSRRVIVLYRAAIQFFREQFSKGLEDVGVKSYYEYMVKLAVALNTNKNSEEHIQKEMMDVLKFEMALADNTLPMDEYRNMNMSIDPITVNELQLKHPDIQWLEFINNLIDIRNNRITKDDLVYNYFPNYIEKLIPLLNRTPKRVLANYAMFHIVDSLIPYLPENLRNLQQEHLDKAYYNPNAEKRRWKNCLDTATQKFEPIAGALYIRNYLSKSDKEKADEITTSIHSELIKTLEKTEWMDKGTRSAALAKSMKTSLYVAYPHNLLNNAYLENILFSEIKNVKTNNFLMFGVTMDLMRHDQQDVFQHPDTWYLKGFPIMLDDMYFPNKNFLFVPPGILQNVYFDESRPRYINFGTIGYLIGNAVTHTLDDVCRNTNAEGNKNDWWGPKTETAFKKIEKCITDQYGKRSLNAVKTKNEDIADNRGIKLAYSAYQTWVEQNEPEELLPGLNYTINQMFWISAAIPWCSKSLTENISEGNNSPPRFRINIPFSNAESFAKDFQCPLGSKMNPKEKCEMW